MTSFETDLISSNSASSAAPAADIQSEASAASTAAGQAAPMTPAPGRRRAGARASARTRPAKRGWRGPGWRWLTLYSLVLIFGLLGVLLAGFYGVRAGLEQRQVALATAVADHFQRGLAHAAAGENALAIAEFEAVLRLQPNHVAARSAMLQAMATTATPQPTSPPLPTPTPPPVSTPYTLDILLSEAQTLYDQKEWTEAAERLERIRAADPAYQADTVVNLLYKIYYTTGSDLIAAGRLEEGIRQIERALLLRPNDKAAQEQKQLAVAYLQAMGYWQANWQKAVNAFADLYKQRPNYLDVETRLTNAAIAYGDSLAQRGAWCDAAAQYNIALEVRPSTALRTTRDAANNRCNDQAAAATPTSSGSATPGSPDATPASPAAGALASGRIYFSTWDGERNNFVLYRVAAAVGARPEPLLNNMRQPRVAPGGARLAVRNVSGSEVGLTTISVKGETLRRVTTFAEDEIATWSPDSQEWIFASNREGDRRWRLYHAWAEGTEATEFIFFGRSPAWYPGKNIAYEGCDDQGNRCGLWQMTPDRAQRTPLTDVAGDTSPAWSPGGSRLAFMSAQRSGNWDIYVRDTKTGKVTPVAASPTIEGLPTWSPDGKWIAFISNRDGNWALYITQPGAEPVRLLSLPGSLPDWMDEQITWGP